MMQIAMSTNGQDYGKQNTILEVLSVPVLTKVGPCIVAGEIILIEGTFGRFQKGRIACMILPDIETGNHTMVLGVIGLSDGVIHGPSTLEVFGRPFASSITPAQGLRLHSQSVVVSGANFPAQESIYCHFGFTKLYAFPRRQKKAGGVEGGTDVSIFGRDFFEGVA
eukprot:scaffold1366_cov245-Chaetoceros_neogracile.AAC.1